MTNEIQIMPIDSTFLSEISFGMTVDVTLLELAAACVRRSTASSLCCNIAGRCDGENRECACPIREVE